MAGTGKRRDTRARQRDAFDLVWRDTAVSRRIGGCLGERMVGVTTGYELDRHVRHDVPALPQIAYKARAGGGAFDAAIDFEKSVMRVEDALFGLVAALRRERSLDPEHRCQPGVVFAGHARVRRGRQPAD